MEYAYSPVLNFLQSNFREGIDDVTIINHALEFFDDKVIKDAKAEFWGIADPNKSVPKRQGDLASQRNLKDILDLLRQCDSDNSLLPIFVIVSPTEVPVIPAVAYSRLVSKISSLDRALKQINEKVTSYDLNFPSLPSASFKPNVNTSITTVVISGISPELNNPVKRRDAIDQIKGHQAIHSIKPSGNKLLVQIDPVAAKDFCDAVPNVLKCDAKLQERKLVGIVKGIPLAYDVSLFVGREGVVDAKRIGQSLTVKIFFYDAVGLTNALRLGLKVEYEIFRVFECLRPPRCCYKCQSPDHMKANCTSPPRCSRCSGMHLSTKDAPCLAEPKCALCGEGHVAFSLKCRVIRSAIAKRASNKK